MPKFENTLWAWILCVVIIRAYSYSCYFWKRVYFVWCIVPRESVLQDSSAHKATCTWQNRHILNSCTDIQTFEPNTMITKPSIQVLCTEFCILHQSMSRYLLCFFVYLLNRQKFFDTLQRVMIDILHNWLLLLIE